jgi:hypothetical protein
MAEGFLHVSVMFVCLICLFVQAGRTIVGAPVPESYYGTIQLMSKCSKMSWRCKPPGGNSLQASHVLRFGLPLQASHAIVVALLSAAGV